MIQFNQVFPAVDLPSEPKQKFRVQCSSDSGSFKLNLEARNSKQQWETVIVNDEDTINGIPKAIVVHALKVFILLISFNMWCFEFLYFTVRVGSSEL